MTVEVVALTVLGCVAAAVTLIVCYLLGERAGRRDRDFAVMAESNRQAHRMIVAERSNDHRMIEQDPPIKIDAEDTEQGYGGGSAPTGGRPAVPMVQPLASRRGGLGLGDHNDSPTIHSSSM